MPTDFESDMLEYGGRRPTAEPEGLDGDNVESYETPYHNFAPVRSSLRKKGTNTSRLPRVSMNIAQQSGRDEEVSASSEEEEGEDIPLPNFEASARKTKTPGPKQGISQSDRSNAGTTGSQKSKFVRETDVPDSLLLTVEVTLRKEDYGEPGTSEYRKNRQMATHALEQKFGVARHKIVSDAEDGDASKNMHIQQVIVSTLQRIKEGEHRSKSMDFMGICVMPRLIESNIHLNDCSTWWDDSEINVWKDWDQVKEEATLRWQYSINKRFSDGDRIASNWLQEFVYNSSTDSLRNAVNQHYEKLAPLMKGGVTYLYYTLCEMFLMSREVEDSMITFLGLFRRKGVARYAGENLVLVREEVLGICKRLDAVGALRHENVMDVLTGLSICTNFRFKGMFTHLKQAADLDNLTILPGIEYNSTALEMIEVILNKAVAHYDALCTSGLWNKTNRGGPSGLGALVENVNKCWNCGKPGCSVGKCKEPKDQARIEKNKKAYYDQKNSSGGQETSGGGGQSRQQRREKKGDMNDPNYQRKVWASNAMTFQNGKLYVNCKTCGLNLNHSTKYHPAWIANKATFKMPANNFYMQECARLQQDNSGSHIPPSDNSVPRAPTAGSGSGMVSLADLDKKLSDFERNSTDPNASSMTEMLRALLLK